MELFEAHAQWSTRPEDQRFQSLEELYQATWGYARTAHEANDVPLKTLRAEAIDGDVRIVGKGGEPAKLTHWSFGQLCDRAKVPAAYARTLPATLAVQNVNHGLAHRAEQDAKCSLLVHVNGSMLLRSMNGLDYQRVWNWEIAQRLLQLQAKGWEVARPDIRLQDDKLPLYASDHDLFAFIRHGQKTLKEGSKGDTLWRGAIVVNSEVGAAKLRILRFLYREMCGNHIIWGAEGVEEIALRHVGNIRERMSGWEVQLQKYLDQSGAQDEAAIERLMSKRIAGTKEEVLDTLFGLRINGLTRKALTAGYAAVNEAQDGDPLTVWGMVQGLTRYSQTVPYADERTVIDVAAGKVLAAFK